MTPLGRRQAETFPSRTPELQQKVNLLVTSPLKRALHTTLLAWKPAVARLGIESVIVLPEAQECADEPCDTGSPKEVLVSDQDFKGLDLSRVTADWTSKKGFYAPDAASLANRASYVRRFLRDRSERDIVLVCHGDFLRQLTGDESGPSRTFWKNAEMRVYKFNPATVHQDMCFLKLEEVPEATKGYSRHSTEADLEQVLNGKI